MRVFCAHGDLRLWFGVLALQLADGLLLDPDVHAMRSSSQGSMVPVMTWCPTSSRTC
jgi:hypothetical protein